MLDNLGKRIMGELHKDARQTFRNIGRQLGVAEGTVRNRVKNWKAKDAIKMRVTLDPKKFGLDFICITGFEVQISSLNTVEKILTESPNVYYLAGCTGNYDFMAIFFFHNAQEFDDYVFNTITKLPGILKVQTYVNIHMCKGPWMDNMNIIDIL